MVEDWFKVCTETVQDISSLFDVYVELSRAQSSCNSTYRVDEKNLAAFCCERFRMLRLFANSML